MCKCGCNTCGTNEGPLLTEGKVKSLLSEGLQYHIDKKIPLFETVYRIGSNKHLSLIKEARKMYSRNVIDLCEEDEHLIKTHLGEFALYEGESVPLDLPMLDESYYTAVANLGSKKTKENLDTFEEVQEFLNKMKKQNAISVEVTKFSQEGKFQTIKYDWDGGKWLMVSKEEVNEKEYLQEKLKGIDGKECWKGYKLAGTKKKGGKTVDNCVPMEEAEFKGKEVALGKPKRGGPKAYYVYVKDGDKVKKVTFGSGGLRAKIKNKEARNAFAARHNCDKKTDRTTAGYWSCNLPKYASLLGLGANQNTYW